MKRSVAILAMLCVQATAAADISKTAISEYKTALESGQSSAVIETSLALAAEAVKNADDGNASLLAFEAAWSLCSLGRCADAIAAADFAAGQPITNASSHPVPEDRKLLAAYTKWRAEQNTKTRRGLDAALDGMDGVEPSLLSINAFQTRFLKDRNAGETSAKIRQVARSARLHMEPVKDIVTDQYVVASFSEALFGWFNQPSTEAHRRMLHTRGLLQVMASQERYSAQDNLQDLRYEAEAWADAMAGFIRVANRRGSGGLARRSRSTPKPIPREEVAEIQASYQAQVEPSREEVPRCIGRFTSLPEIDYPGTANQRGLFGASRIGFIAGEEGPTDYRIIASVPEELFGEAALEAIKTLEWKWADQQPVEECRKGFDVVYPVNFIIR